MNAKRRVAITGMGAVTPLGGTMEYTWNGVMERMRPVGPVSLFDVSRFPCQIAYEVKDFQWEKGEVPEREEPFLNRAARFGCRATREALKQAGLAEGVQAAGIDPFRAGVCLGVGMGSPPFEWYDQVFASGLYDDPSVGDHSRYFPDQLGSSVARMSGCRGEITTVHTACASSGQSIGEAFEQVAYGDLDVVVTGGADSMIHPFYLAGFSLLGALSGRNDDPETASRPFDVGREGFVLGEGSCILILEEWEHAKRRQAPILGELRGYGISESAYRITDLHPEGTGPVEAMQMALDDAGIGPEKVGYLNAHGTSTPLNDRIESLAVSRVFPADRAHVQVSSTKSMTGHMISAAGAIELAFCLKALEHQVLPASVNLFREDKEVACKMTPSEVTPARLEYALSNSVGFGGSNTALVVRGGEGA